MKKTDIIFVSIICFLFLELLLFIPLTFIFLEGYFWCVGISWLLFFIACPILLVFQIIDKEKTTLNKVLLTINSLIVALIVFCFIAYTLIMCTAKKEISSVFDNAYLSHKAKQSPVIGYLEDYRNKNNVFPKLIQDKKLLEDKNIEKIEYKVSKDLNGYDLKIHKKNGAMEVYQRYESKNVKNDENSSTFNFVYLDEKKAKAFKAIK